MLERKRIDAHGHFGKSFLGPESTIPPYILEAKKLGIIACIASPGPTPEINEKNKILYPCLWRVENNQISYIAKEINGNSQIIKTIVENNPYHNVNIDLLKTALKYNHIDHSLQLYVMPIHHPILDTSEEVKEIISNQAVVALKVHGIATFTGPEDISVNIIDNLLKINKPLIVHTDMYQGQQTTHIHRAYQLNDPVKWAEWGRETGVKTLITHGARLSPIAIEIVKSTPNLMIGLSPDLLLMGEPERLHHDTKNFLIELLYTVPSDKLLFDIDYGWNVSERDQWDKQDWKMCERIDFAAAKAGLTQLELDRIYLDNAIRFYNI